MESARQGPRSDSSTNLWKLWKKQDSCLRLLWTTPEACVCRKSALLVSPSSSTVSSPSIDNVEKRRLSSILCRLSAHPAKMRLRLHRSTFPQLSPPLRTVRMFPQACRLLTAFSTGVFLDRLSWKVLRGLFAWFPSEERRRCPQMWKALWKRLERRGESSSRSARASGMRVLPSPRSAAIARACRHKTTARTNDPGES
jgi:hypothetical protein